MTSRVTRSIVNPSGSRTKEASPEKVKVKKIPTVKKPKKEEEIYQVEALLDKKKMNGVWRYKVKWQGYSDEECTWEPAKNLENVKYMINEFNQEWRKKQQEEDSDNESGSDNDNEENESSSEASEESEEKKPVKKTKAVKPKAQEKEKKEKKGKTSTDRESRKEKNIKKKEERKSSVTKSQSPKKKLKTEKDTAPIPKGEHGTLSGGDKIKKLLVAKSENGVINFSVEWEQRKDGVIPKKSYVTNTELRKHHKDLLLDYYEERLKFVRPAGPKSTVEKSVSKDNKNEPAAELEKSLPQQNNKDAIEEEKVEKKNNDNMEIEKEGENNKEKEQVPAPVAVEKQVEPQQQEAPAAVENVVENGKVMENLDSTDLIQNQGQLIFADVGGNSTQELRDLALDANLNIFNEAEKAKKDAEALRNEALTESPKDTNENQGVEA